MAGTIDIAPAGSPTPSAPPPGHNVTRAPREQTSTWPLADRVGYWLALVRRGGALRHRPGDHRVHVRQGHLLPEAQHVLGITGTIVQQSQSGGFLDPIEGTLIVSGIGILIAAPLESLWLCG